MAPDATIFALATARGRGAVAIIRVSGARSFEVVGQLCGGALAADRRLVLRKLRADGELLDSALVAAFAKDSSPTGEPYAELHLHGGHAVIEAATRWLGRQPGLRHASPGEFSRRALAAGRADLTQLEGMADLVAAETDAQRRQALRLLGGGLGREVAAWRSELVGSWALLEACIDFSDEELPDGVIDTARQRIGALAEAVSVALAGFGAARAIRDGVEIAVVGAPNAGKSTLINALAGRDVALTSALPGTTRDVIEVRLDLNGFLVTLLDTAGLRESADPLEAAGVARARLRGQRADIVVLVEAHDAPAPPEVERHDLRLWNKADMREGCGLNVSALTGRGIDSVIERLAELVAGIAGQAGPISSERHARVLRGAVAHLRAAVDRDAEIAVEELRLAAAQLDMLLGRVDPEDVLDEVFARFCIGK